MAAEVHQKRIRTNIIWLAILDREEPKKKTKHNSFSSLKEMLQPIFCIDIDTHSDGKSKNYVKFRPKNVVLFP